MFLSDRFRFHLDIAVFIYWYCTFPLMDSSYLERKTNSWVWSKINFLVGPQEPLLQAPWRRKHAQLGHVTCLNSLQNIFQGALEVG